MEDNLLKVVLDYIKEKASSLSIGSHTDMDEIDFLMKLVNKVPFSEKGFSKVMEALKEGKTNIPTTFKQERYEKNFDKLIEEFEKTRNKE